MDRSIYLDYCATTPVHPEVKSAVMTTLERSFGNPSSMHWAGREAAKLLDDARTEVATEIGCAKSEIVFTSGATESDNLALLGIMRQYQPGKAHLITSAIEHHAILHTAQHLEQEGYDVTYVPVDNQGLVDPAVVKKAIRPETRMISIMLVNNEVGSIQPLAEIGKIARENEMYVHTDAVQGIGYLNIDVNALNVDLLSLSAHKIYGPKGIGALYVRDGVRITPLTYGGSQEMGLKPGTENLPGIVGLGAAIRLVRQHKDKERIRLARVRESIISKLRETIPGLIVNGPVLVSPHVLSVSFPGADAEMMLIRLNGEKIAVSLGSACTSKDIEPSHVLTSMGLPHEQIEGTLRISFGYPTTEDELARFLEVLPEIWRKSKVS